MVGLPRLHDQACTACLQPLTIVILITVILLCLRLWPAAQGGSLRVASSEATLNAALPVVASVHGPAWNPGAHAAVSYRVRASRMPGSLPWHVQEARRCWMTLNFSRSRFQQLIYRCVCLHAAVACLLPCRYQLKHICCIDFAWFPCLCGLLHQWLLDVVYVTVWHLCHL